ncbi:MAG: carboxylate-amine ligase [Planctomycetes bacterium]|nr:carboxylate-amine ligase [Planctomycetota bacterium]MBI3847827.1 carboxylate-amine ligase [Planctomycetota bacterium]
MTPEQEIAEFNRLKPKLAEIWSALTAGTAESCTSVVVPSLTLDQGELRKLPGASFYEERLLFLLIRLRNPQARMVFVTSQPIHPMILEYYFQLLAGIPASHARSRLTLVCAHDASPRALTEKILERPRLIQNIRDGIQDTNRAFLTVFNSTPLERKLSVLLGIPLNGVDPSLLFLGTKSGSRKVFREAGVPMPEGFEDLRSRTDLEDALLELRSRRPDIRRAVLKLDESFSGEGNAIFTYPESKSRGALHDALSNIEFSLGTETPERYFEQFERMGGIVEEFLEGREKHSPSAQLRISPTGDVVVLSTHDQLLGGPTGQMFLGCTFPARGDYRAEIQEEGLRVGHVLASRGVVSRFGIDFLAWRDEPGQSWNLRALEINLRMGGTTHPFLALRFLTDGHLDPTTGLFHSLSGQIKYYRATDNLRAEQYHGLRPEDLIEILTDHRLHYNHGTESGVLFHLIGSLSQFGKMGLTVIANSPEEVDALYRHTLEVFDRECSIGRPPRVAK